MMSYNVYYVNLIKQIISAAAVRLRIVTEKCMKKEQITAKDPAPLYIRPLSIHNQLFARIKYIYSLTQTIPISKNLPPTPEYFTEVDFWSMFEKVFSEYSTEIQKARTFKVPRETEYPDKVFPNIGIKL